MDREKKDELPRMQVGFIDAICLPVYEVCRCRCRNFCKVFSELTLSMLGKLLSR